MSSQNVESAIDAYKAAALAVTEATKAAYPVGTILEVALGNAVVTLKVVGHSRCWWSGPGENVLTGKRRTFHNSNVLTLKP